MVKAHGTPATKAIALSIGALMLAAFVILVVLPVAGATQAQLERTAALRDSIQQLHELASNRDQLNSVLAQLEKRNVGAQLFLRSDKASTAAAEIEQLLKAVVTRRGGTIVSTQALPEANDGEHRSVSINTRIRCTLPELVGVLHNLETASTALFVRGLKIQARNSVAARSDQERSWRDLDVEFELEGYISGAAGA